MSLQITPCLVFNGNCSKAMNFYQKVFDRELSFNTYADSSGMVEYSNSERIMYAQLVFKGNEITGRDILKSEQYILSNSFALNLEYEYVKEALRINNELSENEPAERRVIQHTGI